jgi:GNAT superfamily N-acetyltransferase
MTAAERTAEEPGPRAQLTIEPFRPEFAAAFERLNREWIERLFALEPADEKILSNPEEAIIAPGGQIYFARFDREIVGTAAAVASGSGRFELAKMAVSPDAQGRGIGRLLGEAVIGFARSSGGQLVFLLTNSRLANAIHLYERLGFQHRPLPEDTGYRRADVYMELPL